MRVDNDKGGAVSEKVKHQYAEDGGIIGECECGRARWIAWGRAWGFGIGNAYPPYICQFCGSLCRADGTATPGTEVLWEAVRVMAKEPGIIGVQESRVNNGDVRAALISARACIAARKAETSAV